MSDDIYTDENCYVRGESIDVMFSQCNPLEDDWVGVYYSDADDNNLGDNYRLWVWACGNQVCRGKVYVGSITFDAGYPVESGTDSWPLNAGRTYQVHLIRRNQGGPYSSYAMSNEFRVVPYGGSCTITPAPHPAPTHQSHPAGSHTQPSARPHAHSRDVLCVHHVGCCLFY